VLSAAKDHHHDHSDSITHKMKDDLKELAQDTKQAISQAADKVKHAFTEKKEEAKEAATKTAEAAKNKANEVAQDAKSMATKAKDKISGAATETQQDIDAAAQRVRQEVQGISFTSLAKSAFLTACSTGPLTVAAILLKTNYDNFSRFTEEKLNQSLFYGASLGCITCAIVTLQKAYSEFNKGIYGDVEINIKSSVNK
jgi:vacuolar-type H+-ATPase subunit E/Vma4